ncbi:MAG: beta-propeller domain-containing protein [Thiovulaceae bacterium]|nr:beta-propeller domain-containing protein [Sulfurimonadaceae bacterium]
MIKDSEYLLVEDSAQVINILNLDNQLSDTGSDILLTDTRSDSNITSSINDIYINNKVLYISKSYGYETVEYKDINNTVSSAFGSTYEEAVNSITFSNSSLILAKGKTVIVTEATPDYADSISAQTINEIDMSNDINSTITTGQFSNASDVDAFHYINNYYTGTLSIEVTAANTVDITIYNSDGNILTTGEDNISSVVNADDVFIDIKSKNGDLDSFSFSQTYELDGVYDILDDSLVYDAIVQGEPISGNLYEGGYDKDYFELNMTERGTINFNTNGDNKVKVTLLYKSGTVIASNYDEQTQILETEFKADLSKGNYMILVESFEPIVNEPTHDYQINTVFTAVEELVMDSGASLSVLNNIASFSYVDRHFYMLKDGTLTRMSNVLQPKQEIETIGFDDNESVYRIFSYNDDTEEKVYVSRIDLADNSFNKVGLYRFDNTDGLYLENDFFDMSGITDEEIMYIDKLGYVYYYDEDSLYIAPLTNTETPQQVGIESLEIVKVYGNYMYLATDNDVRVVDVSDKNDIDNSKTLSTINIENTKSIFIDIDSNRLFIGANNKIEIYNISNKDRVELLSEYTIGFNDQDLWYEGTPSSMYLLEDKLYTTVQNTGIVVFDIDEFNELSIDKKALNLGENLTQIYTFHGDAINYVVDNEVKVYFLSDELLDADTAATYTIVDESSVDEGSKTVEGCFIATAAYGSYFDSDVKILRDFRDDYLKTNALGRAFVDIYYDISPPIARSISDNELAKNLVRATLTPVVYMIKYPVIFAVIMFMLIFLAYKKVIKKPTRLGSI